MTETRISAGGRVVIPKKMRERFGLKEGEGIIIELEGRKIVLKPKKMIENPVDALYGSARVRPEESPKKVAREWVRRALERETS